MNKKSRYNQDRNKTTQNYIRENYQQLSIRLYKPETGKISRDLISKVAENAGMSVNSYIIESVEEKMHRDGVNIDEIKQDLMKTVTNAEKNTITD